MTDLFVFIGTDCPHCVSMIPLLEKLHCEEHVTYTVYDIWANETDYRLYENITNNSCDGIPVFYNTHTKVFVYGLDSFLERRIF